MSFESLATPLQLAQLLDRMGHRDPMCRNWQEVAAAEMRRMHAELAQRPALPAGTIAVDAEALHRVLSALCGPEHHIRELQHTRSLDAHGLSPAPNPINVLLRQYEAHINTHLINKAPPKQPGEAHA